MRGALGTHAARSDGVSGVRYELRRANEILIGGVAVLATELDADRPKWAASSMKHRGRFGVEPICRTLDVSASASHQRATGERPARQIADEQLLVRIEQLHAVNYHAYGYRRI